MSGCVATLEYAPLGFEGLNELLSGCVGVAASKGSVASSVYPLKSSSPLSFSESYVILLRLADVSSSANGDGLTVPVEAMSAVLGGTRALWCCCWRDDVWGVW